MADRIPDSLIDEILASVKKYETEDTNDISSENVDALLEDIKESVPSKVAEEKTTVISSLPKADAKEKFKVNISEITETDKTVVLPNITEDVSVHIEENGQIGFSADGTKIGGEETKEEAETPKEELKSVSGQISIEKTRMFNEVKIRGEYNPNISHNLGNKVTRTTTGEGDPLSTPVMSEEKYRKHFMNRPVQNIEKTQEHRKLIESLPEKTIETPGVVVKKNRELTANTDGIEPLPVIVPAEYELEQEKNNPVVITEEKDIYSDNQIMLEGFGEEDEPIMQQSEEEAEAELRETRKTVVDNFMNGGLIFKQEVEDGEIGATTPKRRFERRKVSVAREYYGPKDTNAVYRVFEAEKKSLVAKLSGLSVICLIMSFLAAVAGAENGNFEIYGNNEYVYVATQLVLLLVACGVCYHSFVDAIKGLKNKVFDMNTIILASSFAGVLQCFVGFGFTDSVESSARLLAGAAVLPMILKTVGELIRCKGDMANFEIVSDEENEFYCVQNIGDEDTANEIARGLMLGNPDIKYSAKIGFPARFVELSRSAEVTGPLLKIAVPAVSGVALLIGIIFGILSANVFVGVSAFAGAVLMGLPLAASLCAISNLYAENKKLNEEGSLINGYSAVEDAVNSNGIMVDACDAFVSGGCNIEGIKLYHKMRIDEAILYTASVIIESGGVLSDIFNGVIIGKQELLFPVESLAYEEKLGCSCWIHNHRVLVGNRELLVHHNVETPDEDLENKFKQNGRNVIYLAIEGKIAAMFVVVYKANEETARYMQELEKDGLTIFFRTSDANITEEFIESEFGLPSNVVKIINPIAGEMFTKVKNSEIDRADAMIMHNGSAKTMFSALHSAFTINSYVNTSKIIQFVSSFLGVAIVTLLAGLSSLAQIGVWQIILYQGIWAAVLSVLPILRKK
mgnify:CR=1 FL=1